MTTMKLYNITDVDKFFDRVNACKGPVMLYDDGQNLDLKSKLAQYFSLAKYFVNGKIAELRLQVEEEDSKALMEFTSYK